MTSLVPPECLEPRVLLRHGAPAAGAASAAAYDSTQQTLAFALQDGQLLLYGGDGEQDVLCSACDAATRFLHFLSPSPYLLRVSVQSEVELWSLRDLNLSASSLWPGADITAVCGVAGTSFIIIGTEDGSVQAVCLRGSVVSVRASVLECGSPVVVLAVQPEATDSGRVLVGCASGLVVLLDLESKQRVLELQTGVHLTCAAWVDAATFATAHAGGELRCWSLSREAADVWRAPPARPGSADLVGELTLDAPVAQLVVSPSGGLVVTLGNDSACLVSVVHEGSRALGIVPLSLPSGFAAWVQTGWKPRLLLALTVSSTETTVQVHDGSPERLAWETVPVGWPAASATCAQLLCDSSALLAVLDSGGERSGLAAQVLRPAASAAPPLGAARLLITGHADGLVRLSSASGTALITMTTLTVGATAVTRVHADLSFCAACTSAREVCVHALDATLSRCGGAPLDSEPLCVAVSEAAGVIAVGCTGGGLATWCLPSFTSGRLLRPLPSEDVTALLFVSSGESGPLLLALGSACGIAAIHPGTGNTVSTSRPKVPAVAVALFALDQSGAPVLGCSVPSVSCDDDGSDDADSDGGLSVAPLVAETLVICSQTALRSRPIVSSRHAEPELEYCFARPVHHAQMFVAPGGACIACLDDALTLHVLEAAVLVPVCSVSLLDIADDRLLGVSAAVFAASMDGHVFALFDDSLGQRMTHALRLELLEEFSAPEAHPEPPVLWDRSRVTATEPEAAAEDDEPGDAPSSPAKRTNLLAGLGGLRARAAQALKHAGVPGFKQRRHLKEDDYESLLPPPAAPPPPAPFVRTRLEVGDGGRAELFGETSQQAPALRSVDDIRRKYGRPARPESATTAGVMGENLTKLNERGEKLANIQEKTALMESRAADFAASAKKLKEQQEAKTLFGLFS